MKKFLLILLFGTLALMASAQSITNVTVLPTNPTADDSIKIITETSFAYDAYSVVNQVNIDTNTHIINIQLFKCKYSTPPAAVLLDTFSVGQLAEATWTLNIMLFTAQYNASTATCGTFSMADTDNSSIIVSQPGPVTGIEDRSENIIGIYPNPAQNILNITGAPGTSAKLTIMTMQGQAVMQKDLHDVSEAVSLDHLANGIYLYSVTVNDRTVNGKLAVAKQ